MNSTLDQTPKGPARLPAAFRYFPWFVLFLAVITLVRVASEHPETINIQKTKTGQIERIAIQDFASHLVFSKEVWHNGARYDVPSHLEITSRWAGMPVNVALPFGYSPTMAILLGPFIPLRIVWAYILWSVAGFIACGWMIKKTGLVSSIIFVSPLAMSAIVLGQTAFLTMAAYLGISVLVKKTEHENYGLSADVCIGLLLWALTAKPPVAIAAIVALLMNRCWKGLAFGGILTIAGFALMTPKFGGTTWISDYLTMIRTYNTVEANSHFAWSLHPETMTNLRGLLTVVCNVPDNIASNISNFAWLSSMLLLLGWTLFRRQTAPWTFATALLTYLMFCPHLTSTEDLHLTLLLAYSSWWSSPDNFAGRRSSILDSELFRLFIPLLILLNPGPAKVVWFIPVVFAGKLFLLGVWASSAGTTKINPKSTRQMA